MRINPKLLNMDSSALPPETISAGLGWGQRICASDEFSGHVLLVHTPHSEYDCPGNSENSSQKKQVLPYVFDLICAILFNLRCPFRSCHLESYLVFNTHFKHSIPFLVTSLENGWSPPIPLFPQDCVYTSVITLVAL